MDDESYQIARQAVAFLGIAMIAAACRSILTADRRSFIGFCRGVLLAAAAGGLVGLSIQDLMWSPSRQFAIIGVSAFMADDILLLIYAAGQTISNNPRILLDPILARFFPGRKS